MSFDQMPRTPHSLTMLKRGCGELELRILKRCKISSIHSSSHGHDPYRIRYVVEVFSTGM